MRANLPAILFLVAGIIALVPRLDTRISWALVAIAGVLMMI